MAWEVAEKVRNDQQIPARIELRISQGRIGDFRGRGAQVNAAEFLYLIAQEIVLMEEDGLPDEVPFKRLAIAPNDAPARDTSPARSLDALWTSRERAAHRQDRIPR